jgi:hypothetical protein
VHIDRAVAEQLRRRSLDAEALGSWREGTLRTVDDETLLRAAAADGRVLVTFDCWTIPERLRRWAVDGRPHAGVILVDERTLQPSDVGGLVQALSRLTQELGDVDWTN